ncbi:mucin TcMUCII, putative [Trypanosoma cruzi marinkellei]|uniref:Mucin TcMUCII, putative n=1 Tax=Trypanosoma cruzi marinkellei TaxID=85056 RepID=K2MAM8_TRYCR|nr:mucin TcMUCII, putative [Trypanosoma cruzi marinkellei]
MMTCRLLCALLVLALCCCPYVCAEDNDVEEDNKTITPTINGGDGTVTSESTVSVENTEQALEKQHVEGHELNTDAAALNPEQVGTAGEKGTPVGKGQGPTVTSPESNSALNTVEREDTKGMTGTESGTSTSKEETIKEVEASAETTTTTTAPEAPSTTTTEAPTVSTTRPPSRPREIDGSLSSSAWVCAPLLLAASVLAYTALG